MDDLTREFMELVKCEKWEVRDADPERLKLNAAAEAAASVARRKAGFRSGEIVMPFGKHKGLTLEEVPRSYLIWLAGQRDNRRSTKSSRKFKRIVQGYLAGS